MKKIVSVILAGTASLAFVTAAMAVEGDQPTATQTDNKDAMTAAYNNARENCKPMTGHEKKVCNAEAKAMRAHAEADMHASDASSVRARAERVAANADYDVARAKCGSMTGTEKSTCINEAKSSRTIALANIKAQQQTASDNTGDAQSQNKTAKNIPANTDADADTATAAAGGNDNSYVADAMITTKVKADLVKEPNLKSMEIHVETVQGTVQLSGFVNSDADAAKAAELARNVKGVKDVKNEIKIK
jgi:osmotically-inducible protein OsmY